MSDKNAKELRKQLRNVVQELLPELLTREICVGAYRQVQADIMARLNQIDDKVATTLEGINDRAQNFQGYLMRELATAATARAENVTVGEPAIRQDAANLGLITEEQPNS